MQMYEWIASAVIGTPLERPAEGLRWLKGWPARLRNPGPREIYLEGARTARLMKAAITDGMNCIDVGCHLGSVLQKIVELSPRGRHIAVEPIPYKAAWLRQKFPAVDVHQVALGEEEGPAEFFFNPRQSGFSGLKAHHPTGNTNKITVACKRLDDLVPADRPIGFMKVDVEGGEYSALRGASRIVTGSRPVILFECTNSGIVSFGVSAGQVFALFKDELGYRIYLIKDWLAGAPPLSLSEFEASMVYPFKAFNYVASHRDRPPASPESGREVRDAHR